MREDFVWLIAEGEFELPAGQQQFRIVLEEALRLGKPKAICDVRLVSGDPTTTQRFELGQFAARLFAENPAFHSIRFAVLGNEPLISAERFAELVALNRGAMGKVFTDPMEAATYLGLEDPQHILELPSPPR